MKNSRLKNGVCVYCGQNKLLTHDHVPPQNLFPKPYPNNLMTVPACKDCNGSFSKDDEYFRVALTITEKAKGHSDRENILPVMIRGLNRPQSERFRNSLLSNSSMMPRFSPGGIYIGYHRAISFDGPRLDRTASRIIKGLFYNMKGYRLPDDFEVNVLAVYRFKEAFNVHPEVELVIREFVSAISVEQPHEYGGVFSYKWLQSPNDVNDTHWLLYFYGSLEFYCTTFAPSSIADTTFEQEIDRVRSAIENHRSTAK